MLTIEFIMTLSILEYPCFQIRTRGGGGQQKQISRPHINKLTRCKILRTYGRLFDWKSSRNKIQLSVFADDSLMIAGLSGECK